MFRIENLNFQYQNEEFSTLALDRIFLEIPKGQWLAIIGSNGSGKSTLARHLNGLLLPAKGSVTVDGLTTHVAENLPLIRRKVGIVFQNPDNQIIGNTVEEDVAFGPENIGVPPAEIRRRITTALEKVGLKGFEQADPNNLSGGQKQRVAIAGALAMEPEALIIDEATAMLDPLGCGEVFKVLQDLHQQGMTIVMITHAMSEVVFADQVAVLLDGSLVALDTPAAIFGQGDKLKEWRIELPGINQIGQLLAFALADAGAEDFLLGLKTTMSVEGLASLLLEQKGNKKTRSV